MFDLRDYAFGKHATVESRWFWLSFTPGRTGKVEIEKEFLEFVISRINIERRVINLQGIVELIQSVGSLITVIPEDEDEFEIVPKTIDIIEKALYERIIQNETDLLPRSVNEELLSDMISIAKTRISGSLDTSHKYGIKTVLEMFREDDSLEFYRIYNHLIDYHVLRCLYDPRNMECMCYLIYTAGILNFAKDIVSGTIWKRTDDLGTWSQMSHVSDLRYFMEPVILQSFERMVAMNLPLESLSGLISSVRDPHMYETSIVSKFLSGWSGFRPDSHTHMKGNTSTALKDGRMLQIDDLDVYEPVFIHIRPLSWAEDFVVDIRLNAIYTEVPDVEIENLLETWFNELFGNDMDTSHEYKKFLSTIIHLEQTGEQIDVHVHVSPDPEIGLFLATLLRDFLGPLAVERFRYDGRIEMIISPNGMVVPQEQRKEFKKMRSEASVGNGRQHIALKVYGVAALHFLLTSRKTIPLVFVYELPTVDKKQSNVTSIYPWPIHTPSQATMNLMKDLYATQQQRVLNALLRMIISYFPMVHVEELERSSMMVDLMAKIIEFSPDEVENA